MASRAGKDTPKRAGAKAAPPPAAPPADEQAPAPAERRPTTEEVREAHYRQMMAEHRNIDGQLAQIDAGRKTIAKRRTEVRNKLKGAGYYLENVDVILVDSSKTRQPRREQQDKVDQLHWMREMEGLPVAKTGEQLDLLGRLPDTEKDAIMWEEDAYHKGVINEPCEIPAGCPPIFHTRWTKKWHDGQDRRKWAMATEVNVERDPAAAASIGVSPVKHDDEEDDAGDDETKTPAAAIDRFFDGDAAEEGCETCKADGSGLDPGVDTCPDCGAEFEPAEEGSAGGGRELVH
jgi:hypothetical protein